MGEFLGMGGFEYSEKEHQLIDHFGFDEISEKINPIAMYRMMAEKAFMEELTGPAVDSLRRCLIAYHKCTVYRMTKEWDDFIQLDK